MHEALDSLDAHDVLGHLVTELPFDAHAKGAPFSDEIEDLVQETLLAVHAKRETYDADLFAIARHKLFDRYRLQTNRTIGRAVASEFARHGWRVGLVARGEPGLEGAKAEVESFGAQALAIPADVADAAAVASAAERVVAEWGDIEVWINCAMVTVYSPVSDMRPEEYRRVTEVTYLLGYVHGTLAALKHMRTARAGTIIQVGSALAYRAIPLQSAYCAAKFAVRGFTDSLRSELINERVPIRLTMVQLPAINTPQFTWARNHLSRRPRPVAPIFSPEAAARAIHAVTERRAVSPPAAPNWPWDILQSTANDERSGTTRSTASSTGDDLCQQRSNGARDRT